MGKEKKPSLGVVFWIALLCFIAVLYIGSRVQFPHWIAQQFGGDYRNGNSLPKSPIPEVPPPTEKPYLPGKTTESMEEPPAEQSPTTERDANPSVTEHSPPTSSVASSPTAEPHEGSTTKSTVPPTRSRTAKLYFVRISETGKPELVAAERKITYQNAPLTETLKALLKGPIPPENERGISTLIPSGTEIKSVSIRDGIALINLNESFQFNPFGAEGYRTQVLQIVYTVTEFPSVQGVQFLIEGRKVDYLSPEGVYIGKPLYRDSLVK